MKDLELVVEGALYREVEQVKDGISIVVDPSTDQKYYKKVLDVFSVPVFDYLKCHADRHIPGIKVFWQEEDRLVVIEELIEGKTLEELLESGKDYLGRPWSFEEKKRVLLEICEGLIFLHKAEPPIIHRDIKASNVIISDIGAVKIIDYDAAKQYIKGKEKDTVLIGTQGIAAPEQYGFAQSDERTDIYALGKLMQRMFPEQGRAEKIIQKATKLQPELRYKSVREMQSHIAKLRDPYATINVSNNLRRSEKVVKGALLLITILVFVCIVVIGVMTVRTVRNDSSEDTSEKTSDDDFDNTSEAVTLANNSTEATSENLDDTKSEEETIYEKAESKFEDGKYKDAIDLWYDIEDYSDSADRILDAKYLYALDNKDTNDRTYRFYIRDLVEAGYDGSEMTELEKLITEYSAKISFGKLMGNGGNGVDASGGGSWWVDITSYLKDGEIGGETTIKLEISDGSGSSLYLTSDKVSVGNKTVVRWFNDEVMIPELGKTYHVTAYDERGNVIGETDAVVEKYK